MEKEVDIFGQSVKASRLAKGLTQRQLSQKLNITVRYLAAIENENRKISYDLLFRIVRELGLPVETIFYPDRKTH